MVLQCLLSLGMGKTNRKAMEMVQRIPPFIYRYNSQHNWRIIGRFVRQVEKAVTRLLKWRKVSQRKLQWTADVSEEMPSTMQEDSGKLCAILLYTYQQSFYISLVAFIGAAMCSAHRRTVASCPSVPASLLSISVESDIEILCHFNVNSLQSGSHRRDTT